MAARTHRNAAKRKTLFCLSALVLLSGVIMWLRSDSRQNRPPPNGVFVAKLLSAQHDRRPNPLPPFSLLAFKPTGYDLASLREAGMAVFGMELREFSLMESGDPEVLFACLSKYGGYGEIIWTDEWKRFRIKMPPATTDPGLVVRRRRAMQAAVRAIRASGGCLIKAGPHRYLVAKISEKKDYEAAIRALGWLHGVPPPWETEHRSK